MTAFISFAFFVMWKLARARVPYVPVPSSVLRDIHNALQLTDESVAYDLGCGDGKVLFYLAKQIPRARYIGIENSPLPILLARIRAYWHARVYGSQVEIISDDFFTHDVTSATHIYMYLFPQVMDELLPILEKRLSPGTRLVSATFKFKNKQHTEEIHLDRGTYQLAKVLYIYQF